MGGHRSSGGEDLRRQESFGLQVTSDFKGQTEPISRAPAANALGMTEDELHFIQQELDHAHDSISQSR